MDIAEQTLHILLNGANQGTTDVVALGTTTAAVALWRRVRQLFEHNAEVQLDPQLEQALTTEPGEQIEVATLRKLLQLLSEPTLRREVTVYGDYVARDKNVFNLGNI